MEKQKNYKTEEISPNKAYKFGAKAFIIKDKRIIFPNENPKTVKAKILKELTCRLDVFQDLIEKSPTANPAVLMEHMDQLHEALYRTNNKLDKENILELQKRYNAILLKIVDRIFSPIEGRND